MTVETDALAVVRLWQEDLKNSNLIETEAGDATLGPDAHATKILRAAYTGDSDIETVRSFLSGVFRPAGRNAAASELGPNAREFGVFLRDTALPEEQTVFAPILEFRSPQLRSDIQERLAVMRGIMKYGIMQREEAARGAAEPFSPGESPSTMTDAGQAIPQERLRGGHGPSRPNH